MARQYSACVLRYLRKFGELGGRIDTRILSTRNVGTVQRLGGSQGLPRVLFSFRSCSKPSGEFRRLMSSYEDIHGTTISERVEGKDRLILRGCKFQGYHGVYNEEKVLGQKFVVDMDTWLDLKEPCESDNLEHTVSYADLFSMIQKVVEGPSQNLIESVASDIACSVLRAYPHITIVRVRICKLSPPVVGFVDKLGLEIYRTSADFVSKSESSLSESN